VGETQVTWRNRGCETAHSVAVREDLEKVKTLVPYPLIGEGRVGVGVRKTMNTYKTLTPSHQGRGNFKTLTYLDYF
jgi:hypothetical protein